MKLSNLATAGLGLALLAPSVFGLGCGEEKPGTVSGAGGSKATGGAGGTGGKATGGAGGGAAGSGGTGGTAASGGAGGGGTGGGSPDASADVQGGGAETGGDVNSEVGDGVVARDITSEIACNVFKDKTKPIAVAAGRKVYCAIDLGSNNLKLQILSLEPGKPLSFKDERQCRVRTGFGQIVAPTGAPKAPLPGTEIGYLTAAIKEFQRICTLDSGTLVGTEATQWARDATNIADVKTQVKTATAVDIEVLTGEDEGVYGYAAATRNAPEKFSLDPGSNSFQIGWLPKGATKARTVSVPYGYTRSGKDFYAEVSTDTYEVARGKHAAKLKTDIDAALGALTPKSSLADLRAAITAGNVKPELFIPGQDGALHLTVKALLRGTDGKWISDKAAYDARVGMEMPTADPMFGDITTKLVPADLTNFFATIIKPADYTSLRAGMARALYGEKALANAVLLDTLAKELGLTTIVLVPQEMPAGYILAKIP